jgi:hypothetical protein
MPGVVGLGPPKNHENQKDEEVKQVDPAISREPQRIPVSLLILVIWKGEREKEKGMRITQEEKIAICLFVCLFVCLKQVSPYLWTMVIIKKIKRTKSENMRRRQSLRYTTVFADCLRISSFLMVMVNELKVWEKKEKRVKQRKGSRKKKRKKKIKSKLFADPWVKQGESDGQRKDKEQRHNFLCGRGIQHGGGSKESAKDEVNKPKT